MMFRPMPPELLLKILETEKDELSEANQNRIAAIKRQACPRCGSSLHPRLNTMSPFGTNDPLPRLNARCPECSYETTDGNLVIHTGDPSAIEPPLPLIDIDKD